MKNKRKQIVPEPPESIQALLDSNHIVLPTENISAYRQIVADLEKDFQIHTQIERVLIEEIASILWVKRRFVNYKNLRLQKQTDDVRARKNKDEAPYTFFHRGIPQHELLFAEDQVLTKAINALQSLISNAQPINKNRIYYQDFLNKAQPWAVDLFESLRRMQRDLNQFLGITDQLNITGEHRTPTRLRTYYDDREAAYNRLIELFINPRHHPLKWDAFQEWEDKFQSYLSDMVIPEPLPLEELEQYLAACQLWQPFVQEEYDRIKKGEDNFITMEVAISSLFITNPAERKNFASIENQMSLEFHRLLSQLREIQLFFIRKNHPTGRNASVQNHSDKPKGDENNG